MLSLDMARCEPWEDERAGNYMDSVITRALALMGVLLRHLLKFLHQVIYTKMTHVPTYSEKMSLVLLLQSKTWLL